MAFIFRHEERQKFAAASPLPEREAGRPLWHTAAFFAVSVGIPLFANWGAAAQDAGLFATVHSIK